MDVLPALLISIVATVAGILWKTSAKLIGGVDPIRDAVLSIITHPSPNEEWDRLFKGIIESITVPRIYFRYIIPLPILFSIMVIVLALVLVVFNKQWPDFLEAEIADVVIIYFAVYYGIAARDIGLFSSCMALFVGSFALYALFNFTFLRYLRKIKPWLSLLLYYAISTPIILSSALFFWAFLIAWVRADAIDFQLGTFLNMLLPGAPDALMRFTESYSIDSLTSAALLAFSSDDSISLLIAMYYVGICGTVILYTLSLSSMALFAIGYYSVSSVVSRKWIIKAVMSREADCVSNFATLVAACALISVIPFFTMLTAWWKIFQWLGY